MKEQTMEKTVAATQARKEWKKNQITMMYERQIALKKILKLDHSDCERVNVEKWQRLNESAHMAGRRE